MAEKQKRKTAAQFDLSISLEWLAEMALGQSWESFQARLPLTLYGETLLESNTPAITIYLPTNETN